VKNLRLWRDDPKAVIENGVGVEVEIAKLLEWYIDNCLAHGGYLGDWWCDGIVCLDIRQDGGKCFKLVGVSWIGCEGIVPFEIDVELLPGIDTHFAKTVFRIGTIDEDGRPKIFDRRFDAGRLIERRPRNNCDWAMAVELTPSNNSR
jgi:hypothetical protein